MDEDVLIPSKLHVYSDCSDSQQQSDINLINVTNIKLAK